MAEMSERETKYPDENDRHRQREREKARTIVKFLRNEMDAAIKRERRAVQNIVDIDREVGSGGVSESIRLAGICRLPNPRSRLLGLCRRKHASHAPTSCLRVPPRWPFLLICILLRQPPCYIQYIMRDPRGKTRYVLDASAAARITRNYGPVSMLQKAKLR